jgi:hypothetical protein
MLVISGRARVVPVSGSQWIADSIPGARLELFEANEGGSHLLPIEKFRQAHPLAARFHHLHRNIPTSS